MAIVLLLARLLLAMVFMVAGLSKLADRAGSQQALLDFGVPQIFASSFSVILPIGEMAIACMLMLGVSAWWGALGACILLLVFCAGMGFNLARGRTPDCYCFGRLYSAPVSWSTLLRTALLAVPAGFIIWYGRNDVGIDLASWLLSLTMAERVGVGVAMLALVAIVIRFVFRPERLRYLMRGLKREPDRGGGEAASQPLIGLSVGIAAPAFQLVDLSDQVVTLDRLCAREKPVLLIFTDPDCKTCNALFPDIARWQREYRDQLTIALLSRGTREANQVKSADYGLRDILLQRDREVALAYRATITPAAALVYADRTIGSPLALGEKAIGSLVLRTGEIAIGISTQFAGPRLRSDLIIEKQGDGDTVRYLIIDAVRGRYWQCGTAQYTLLTLFTGELTPVEIVARYIEQTHIRLRIEQLDGVLRKLEELGFLEQGTHAQSEVAPPSLVKAGGTSLVQRFLTKRWRLFPASRLLMPMQAHTQWLFSHDFLVCCALLGSAAVWIVVQGGWRRGIGGIISGLYLHPQLSIWGQFSAALLITALIHEIAHGLTLQHFGRQPGYCGLGISLLGGIFFYIEIGEIWHLSDRWQRVAVSMAGPLASLVVGAVGTIAWWMLPSSIVFSSWAAALMAAGILTAIYNCFPFARTDGYFALSDWVRIPNLDRKAQSYLMQTFFSLFRRQRQTKQSFSINQRIFLAGYGVIATLVTFWLMLVTVSICWWIVVTFLVPHFLVRQ